MSQRKFKVAIAVNRAMAGNIFDQEDLSYLAGVADYNPIDGLPETMTHQFMAQILPGADAAITCWGTPPVTGEMMAIADKLRLVAHAAGTVKTLLPAEFWQTGCRAASNAPIIAEDVAQTVLAFTLCSLRGLWGYAKQTRGGQWSGGEASAHSARRLDGLYVGVVGASNVGKQVIRILKPFGCMIKLYDPYVTPMEAAELGVTQTGLDELMSTCDVVTLHTPPTPECAHMINGGNLPRLKDGALFINTARGMLVDEPALIKELKTGRIFACIDVTDPEPPAADHPFRSLENVILTPHIAGGHTVNGRKMLGRNAIIEVCNFLNKGLLRYEVRREMLEHMA